MNRRSFIRQSAATTAALAIGGMGAVVAKTDPYKAVAMAPKVTGTLTWVPEGGYPVPAEIAKALIAMHKKAGFHYKIPVESRV
jgi:hypothetical protein